MAENALDKAHFCVFPQHGIKCMTTFPLNSPPPLLLYQNDANALHT